MKQLFLILFVLTINPVFSTNFIVSNLSDSGAGSFRQAITDANADATATAASPHIIDATGVTGTIDLISVLPDISRHVTINGPVSGTLTLNRSVTTAFRILNLQSGLTVIINNLSLTNGKGNYSGGAGIYNAGTLTLNYCNISNCVIAYSDYGYGGGIYSKGTLTLNYCNITSNNSQQGGGLNLDNGSICYINNSTISGNTCDGANGGAICFVGTLTITNSTISGNATTNFGNGGGIGFNNLAKATLSVFNCTITNNSSIVDGGGICNTGAYYGSSCQLSNSIVIGNNASKYSTPTANDLAGTFTSTYGHNIIGVGSAVTGNTKNITGVSASQVLDPTLADNGGPTKTHALISSCSYAVNNGTISGSPSVDQRGIARVDSIDIGAFESSSSSTGMPFLYQNPSNQNVCTGSPSSMNVSGAIDSFKWQVASGNSVFSDITDGGIYSGAATTSLLISSSTGLDGYQYRCVVSNAGCSSSQISTVGVLSVNTTPAITSQPKDFGICSGGYNGPVFTATGGSLNYQWQVNKGTGFNNVTNDGYHVGGTTSFVNVGPGNSSMDGWQYRVIVSNACSPSVTSNSVTLTYYTSPSIDVNPTSQSTCAGGNAAFSVSTSGNGVYYQWQVNKGSGFVNISDGGVYSNSTTAVLNITGATAAMNGYTYRCIVKNPCNYNTGLTSTAASLNITTGVTFSSQPSNQTICKGANTSFSVGANGGTLTYQWQVNQGSGFANISDDATYANSAGSTLDISGASSSMSNYQYRCLVTSSICPLNPVPSDSATLKFFPDIIINTQPLNTAACETSSATLSVNATGPSLSYQWQVDKGAGFSDIIADATYSNVNSATLNISNISSLMNGWKYHVVITDICTSITSNTADLTVISGPAIVSQPVNATSWNNGNVTFSFTASGSNLTYQWQEKKPSDSDFSDINDGSTFANTTTSVLTVNNPSYSMNSYQYRCVVQSNDCPGIGIVTNSITLNVLPINICMVTVEDVTGKNLIVFEKSMDISTIDSFKVYREGSVTNQFDFIGNVGRNQMSTFLDLNSDPTQQPYLYKIAVKDTNGLISPLSSYHKTMHLTINKGVGNTWNLLWNSYEGFTVNTYNIYRGVDLSSMSLLNSVSGSVNSYTDNNAPVASNIYYQIEIVPSSSCSPTAKFAAFTSTKSNIAETQNVTGVKNSLSKAYIEVFPNPAHGKISIKGLTQNSIVTIFDLSGRGVKQIIGDESQINLEGLKNGLYILEVKNDDGFFRDILVID